MPELKEIGTTKPKSSVGRKSKIQGMAKVYLIDQLAKDKPLVNIQKDLKTLYNIDIAYVNLHSYKKKLKFMIEDRKTDIIQKTLDEIPIANQTVRLDREETLYNISQNIQGQKDKDKIIYGISVLREARQETEQLEPVTANIQFNQFNQLTDEQLLKTKKDLEMKILELSKRGGNSYA